MRTISRMATGVDLAELVRTHQAGVWRYLRYLGCDESAADDLTQETFLAVLEKGFDHRSAAETAGYLRTVARNFYLMRLRRERRMFSLQQLDPAATSNGLARAELAGQDGSDAPFDGPYLNGPGLDEPSLNAADELFASFARDDGGESYLDALRECLETLQGRASLAIERFYHDDKSRQEIAQELSMTEDGVKSLLRRSRELLRQCVERKLEGKAEG